MAVPPNSALTKQYLNPGQSGVEASEKEHDDMPLQINTPVEDHLKQFGLLVKREDLSCLPPGPPFSKTRGVFAHIEKRPEQVIGVLDTYHSQAGHAVAEACKLLDKVAVNFYPVRKAEVGQPIKPQQQAAVDLGALTVPLQAGRSAILYHQAKKELETLRVRGSGPSYMMPNALKLPEMITETAAEVQRTLTHHSLPPRMPVIIAASSGTIAAGVIKGFADAGLFPQFIIHQGYDRPLQATVNYIAKMSGVIEGMTNWEFVNEGFAYGDKAPAGPEPLWPCNVYYDLKAFRWWMREGRAQYGEALLWNIG